MTSDFRAVVLAHLGNPPPSARAERENVYARIRSEFDATFSGENATDEHEASALALERAIEMIEAELDAAGQTAAAEAPAIEPAEEPQTATKAGVNSNHKGKAVAIVAAAIAILAIGAWYFTSGRRDLAAVPGAVIPQKEVSTDLKQDLDRPASDKARSFLDALRDGDAGTVAFLMQSGYRPTRVELRTALLQMKYTPQIQGATGELVPDIRDIACGFTSYPDVRKPMTPPRLFDAEDAFAIMKQMGQELWKSTCATDRARWRDALAKIEQQYAQYSKPDAEKKAQTEACVRRFNTKDATDRWQQANCEACPESHSNCEAYCPQAPKAADADEARFFSFNRSDMFMAKATSRSPNSSSAELYCNLQYLTRPTEFDLANLQRFRTLVSLFE